MTNTTTNLQAKPPRALRERAEKMLQASGKEISEMPIEDIRTLVHELQVHQIELEIQNEELRQTQFNLAEARDRYSDLYEFAPVGYVTLDRDGKILQANLSAATMLRVERKQLVGAKFSDFIDRTGQDEWYLHLQAVFSSMVKQRCELRARRGGRRSAEAEAHWLRLESIACNRKEGESSECRMALSDITEQKQQESLRESEQRFRTMADGVPLLIWVHNAKGEQEFVNRSFCEFFGVRSDEMSNDHWKTLMHPEDATAYSDEFTACLRDQRPFYGKARVRRFDGEWRWLESWGNPRFTPTGEFLGCVGASRDITQRKRAEEEVRHLNATLEQQVLERTSVLSMLNDVASMANQVPNVESALVYVLKRVSQHNGWSFGHAWLPSQDDADVLLPGYVWYGTPTARISQFRDLVLRTCHRRGEGLVGRVFASGVPEFTTDINRYLSDLASPVEEHLGIQFVAAFPILAEGNPIGVLEFFSEDRIEANEQLLDSMSSVGLLLGRIVEREQAARALQASEERQRAVFNAVPDAIITTDYSGFISGVNPITEQIFGYSTEELIGKNISMLIPSPYREQYNGYISQNLDTREFRIIDLELFAQRKDGAIFPVTLAINTVDRMGLLVNVMHDISNRRELEKQVVDAAAEEQRRIGQDIHDGLGQRLTGLRYMAQTHAEKLVEQASSEAQTAERMTQWLETVQRQIRTIIRELVPVEVDQQGLVAALRELAERTMEAHQLPCKFDCTQPITLADATLATHMYRIAQEAIANAVRHANATLATIRLEDDGDSFKLLITDNGIGVCASGVCSVEHDKNSGFGLRTMAYRAGLIGARFDIDDAEQGGTVVTCVVPKSIAVDSGEGI